jgi:hypothetical protein
MASALELPELALKAQPDSLPLSSYRGCSPGRVSLGTEEAKWWWCHQRRGGRRRPGLLAWFTSREGFVCM